MSAPISKYRRRAMERGCRYRQGDQCPCEDVLDCHCPDEILIAEQAKRLQELVAKFQRLVKREQEWNGGKKHAH